MSLRHETAGKVVYLINEGVAIPSPHSGVNLSDENR
jgi:hypothetical protein